MLVTLVLTLAIPLQQAVFLGVLLSILVHFFITSSHEVRLTQFTSNAGRHGDRRAGAGRTAQQRGDGVADLRQHDRSPAPRPLEAIAAPVKRRRAPGGHPAAAGAGRYRQQLHLRAGTLLAAAQGPGRQAHARRRQFQGEGTAGPYGDHRRHPRVRRMSSSPRLTSAPARAPRSPRRRVGSSRSLRQRLRRMRKTYHRRTHRWG